MNSIPLGTIISADPRQFADDAPFPRLQTLIFEASDEIKKLDGMQEYLWFGRQLTLLRKQYHPGAEWRIEFLKIGQVQ